ncbi:AsmA-like C-terminal region-containing protein [Tropicimonas sp. IMCC6043]|uniref:AsmA-like C-terminal region-containing protein n=1 Tax=Tropicimonas sp. IMCC6043 TaxID=2510645 RepID=UPI00101DB96B|nr:AsmA-like C-terminal region-containing protein [Tropicimonas sp. IMCC6043]RYH12380.1 hypothetical protein EU800_02140 [Tropicimonas sp. IMCC6043]
MLSWSLFILFDIVVLVGLALYLAYLTLPDRDLPAPAWAAEKAGALLSRGLGGGRADVGAVILRAPRNELPELIFRDVRVRAADGLSLVTVPALQVVIDKSALWQGRLQPRALMIDGADVALHRRRDGSFDFGFGEGAAPAAFASLDEAIAAVRRAFDLPALAPVERVEVRALEVFYEDARARRAWQVSGGSLLLTHTPESLSLAIALQLPEGGAQSEVPGVADDPASVALRLSLDMASGAAEASALVEDVAAADISAHSPALSWLEPIRARVSGAVIVGRTAEGGMGPLNGTLEIGAGQFQPETGARPIPFDGARTYFSYRPELARISFEAIDIRAPEGTLSATGHAYLEGIESGWPTALLGQFRFSALRLDPPGLLPQPAVFGGGALDAKVSLDPFEAKIGQLVLSTADAEDGNGTTELSAEGSITADAEGWHVALDMAADRVRTEPMLALWPEQLVPGTRAWIARNLLAGELFDMHAGLRFDQGARPDLAMTFQFRDADIRPMQQLPPITGASGYATTGRQRFAATLETGQLTPPEGGTIDLAGSTFRVADMSQTPATGELLLEARAPVTAALSLLDEDPFRFLSQADLPVRLAEGRAQVEGRIAFPIKDGLVGDDVRYRIAARSPALQSDVIVPDRVLEARQVRLSASPAGLNLTGEGTLDGVPATAQFELPFGSEAEPASVTGDVEIGARFVETFGIGLPDGSVTGAGSGRFTLSLPRGAPIRYSLDSELDGVGLALPDLGWSKPRETTGRLSLSGRLGARPGVDALELEAAGLTAEGSITTTEQGGLDVAQFSRVSVGDWLDAPVTLRGRGPGLDPGIEVDGGWIDIRKTSMGSGGGSGGGGATSGPPLLLSLDRLVISDGIALHGFRGALTRRGGYSGDFAGSVNGRAPVRGTLQPGRSGGTSVRIRSGDAGAVFKAAGLFQQASGGSMDLMLQPRGSGGEYDGELKVEELRVRSSSGLTALANAISVVGLIDELGGAGILFSDVEAVFRLTPSFVQVTRASGVGPSLGITMEGVYDMVSDRLDMQGVFSPVYMVNSIGQIFTRKGEGLFGFTYRMSGPSADPRVDVNPLSALTPGMFREIFRAPPPKPRSGG